MAPIQTVMKPKKNVPIHAVVEKKVQVVGENSEFTETTNLRWKIVRSQIQSMIFAHDLLDRKLVGYRLM